MKNEKLIKSLIKDNLIHNKLVVGLNETGLEAGKFYLHLCDTIVQLAGINLSDAELDDYFKLFDSLVILDIEDKQQLETGCNAIYNHILELKNKKLQAKK